MAYKQKSEDLSNIAREMRGKSAYDREILPPGGDTTGKISDEELAEMAHKSEVQQKFKLPEIEIDLDKDTGKQTSKVNPYTE